MGKLVIFIPGLYGTKFSKKNTTIFPPSFISFVFKKYNVPLYKLQDDNISEKLCDEIYKLSIYKKLLERLRFNGFVELKNRKSINSSCGPSFMFGLCKEETGSSEGVILVNKEKENTGIDNGSDNIAVIQSDKGPGNYYYIFCYNWSKRPSFNAQRLFNELSGIQIEHGFKELFFICHSMGGFLTRIFFEIELVTFQTEEEKLLKNKILSNTKEVFMVGVPMFGSEYLWTVLSQPHRAEWLQFFGFFSRQKMKKILLKNPEWTQEMLFTLLSPTHEVNIRILARYLNQPIKSVSEIYFQYNIILNKESRVIINKKRCPRYVVILKEAECHVVQTISNEKNEISATGWSDGVVSYLEPQTSRNENFKQYLSPNFVKISEKIEGNKKHVSVVTKKKHFRLLENKSVLDLILSSICGDNVLSGKNGYFSCFN